MRNLSYLIVALFVLGVPSPALAATDDTGTGGGGGDPAVVGDVAVEEGDGAGGDDRSWTLDESETGGCSLTGVPPAGQKAALALLGLAFMSFGIRLGPRRRRARAFRRR